MVGWAPVFALLIGVVVQGILLLRMSQGEWFLGDDWDFLLTRGTIPGKSQGWWAPHNQHWSTIMVLVFRLLFPVGGLHNYTVYVGFQILMHLCNGLLMYVLLRRMNAGRWVPVAVAWLVVFLGAGTEALLSTTSLNHTGSLLFMLVAAVLFAYLGVSRRGIVALWLALLASLMFSASGLPALFFVALWVTMAKGWRWGLRVASFPAGCFLLWYVAAGREGGSSLPSREQLQTVPRFFWTALINVFDASTGVPEAGALVFAVVAVATLLIREGDPRLRTLARAGLVAALFYLLMISVFRSTWGIHEALSGRYVYACLILLCPAVALCLGRLVTWRRFPMRVTVAVIVLALAGYTVHNVQREHQYATTVRVLSSDWPATVRAMVAAVRDGERPLTDESGVWAAPTINARLVSSPQIRRALPRGPIGPQARLDAEQMFFVGVRQRPFGLYQATKVWLWYGFDRPFDGSRRCEMLLAKGPNPALVVETGSGAEISIASGATSIQTQLVRDRRKSSIRTWPVRPGRWFIATSARDAQLVVVLNKSGLTEVCQGTRTGYDG